MKIYVIGFLRAVLFVVLAAVIYIPVSMAVFFVIGRIMVAPQDLAPLQSLVPPKPENAKFFARLLGKEAPDEIDRLLDDALEPIGPKPPLAVREAQVRQLQQMLQARKVILGGQQPPLAYQIQLNRYMQFRQEVINERAAPQASAQ